MDCYEPLGVTRDRLQRPNRLLVITVPLGADP